MNYCAVYLFGVYRWWRNNLILCHSHRHPGAICPGVLSMVLSSSPDPINDIDDKAYLLSSVLTEGDFYEGVENGVVS